MPLAPLRIRGWSTQGGVREGRPTPPAASRVEISAIITGTMTVAPTTWEREGEGGGEAEWGWRGANAGVRM